MRRNTRDQNAGEIVATLKAAGCHVVDLGDVGKGVPDILVSCARYGKNVLIEIKTERGKLDKKQEAFFSWWLGEKYVVRTPIEALKVMGLQ